MYELLNVLYVLTQGAVLHLDHDAVRVEVEGATALRLPLIRLSAIVLLGRVTVTPFFIQRCAEDGRSLVWLDRGGRFKARIEGPMKGNVLLRREQHLALSDRERTSRIARQFVAGKLQNCRQVLLRAARELQRSGLPAELSDPIAHLARALERLRECSDIDTIRGIEGEGARVYFPALAGLLKPAGPDLRMGARTRRPPLDRVNALLSFLYALLRAECASALEGVGLDPQVGFLHSLRPGRPALALDLMEELRPVLADRLAVTLINRRQLEAGDFEVFPGGAVNLSEEGRRTTIAAFQRRKSDELAHRAIRQKVPLGLVCHVQARLLARHLRGDLAEYPPFLYR